MQGLGRSVCFTFDIEEHHWIEAAVDCDCPLRYLDEYSRRMENCTRWLMEALAEVDARATFFVVGAIGRTHPKLVRDLAAAGHEVACHSLRHKRIHRQSPSEFRLDVRQAKRILEQAAGTPVVGYRAPTFSITRETAWAIDILAKEGMHYDSSIFPVRHDRYGAPDAPQSPFRAVGARRSLPELPPATLRVGRFNLPSAGGGYFRLFPSSLMHAAIRQVCREERGIAVLYFHPWEFDPSQPRLPLGMASRLRTYMGISGSRMRFQRLLARYGSTRMIDALEQIELGGSSLPLFRLGSAVEQSRTDPLQRAA